MVASLKRRKLDPMPISISAKWVGTARRAVRRPPVRKVCLAICMVTLYEY
jgi:hypothetical protein